tara:strand:+ start:148 stop:363 length:216 start_codon:yes stop_codon:yes gene_type:complete
MIDELIGATVWLWPHDHYRKEATLLGGDEHGLYFKITKNNAGCYKIGDILFISNGKPLTYVVLDKKKEASQ